MKNKIFQMFIIVIAFSLFANYIFAQGSYLNLNVGYGLKMSTQNQNYFIFNNYTSGNNSFTYEQVNISLGKGVNFGGSLGYMFNENIGTEIGISYLLGNKSKAKNIQNGKTTEYTLSSKMFRIIPSLVITSCFEKINPYAKFGLVIGGGSIIYEYNEDKDKKTLKMKLSGGIAFGLSSGVGVMFNMKNKMSFFSELNMINLSYAPAKGKTTEAFHNGVNVLPYMTVSEKEIEFVDSYTYNLSNPQTTLEPRKQLKQKFPFGSFGVNLGLRINL